MDKKIYFIRENDDKIIIQSPEHLENIKNTLKLTSFSYNELSKYTHQLTHMGYICIYVPDYRYGNQIQCFTPRSSL